MTKKPHSTTFHSPFELGDKVIADGCDSMVMTVIGFAFYPTGAEVRCAWFGNGVHYTDWFYAWRLTPAP